MSTGRKREVVNVVVYIGHQPSVPLRSSALRVPSTDIPASRNYIFFQSYFMQVRAARMEETLLTCRAHLKEQQVLLLPSAILGGTLSLRGLSHPFIGWLRFQNTTKADCRQEETNPFE